MKLNTATYQMPDTAGDIIAHEPLPELGREAVTIAGGDGASREMVVGMLVARRADGKHVQLDLTASDGSENVRGVMIDNVIALDGEDSSGVIIKALTAFRAGGIIWPEGVTPAQQAEVIDALDGKFITLR